MTRPRYAPDAGPTTGPRYVVDDFQRWGRYWVVRAPDGHWWSHHDRESAETEAALLNLGIDCPALIAYPAPAEGVRA